MLNRFTKWAVSASLALALSGAAGAQQWWWQRPDGDHDRDDRYSQERNERNRFYQQGLRDGRGDREHHRDWRIRDRHWDDRGDRDAYVAGYRAGFGNGGWGYRGDRDRDGDHDGDNRGGWWDYGRNGGGYANMRQAYDFGYQDGLRDGQNDRRTGHSFRPTQGDNYKHGDRGYNVAFGDKQAYKDEYRRGYGPGYQRGYGR